MIAGIIILVIFIILIIVSFSYSYYSESKKDEMTSFSIRTIRTYQMTAVSGYWIVNNKYNKKNFLKWFRNTLKLNCPYIFFGNEESINIIKPLRRNMPTIYINMDITDFYTYKYKDMIKPHPKHCPSKELNMIWNEKIFLLKKAADLNPFNTDYFAWIDAGICTFRERVPPNTIFPNKYKLRSLPNDKIIFCPSESPIFDLERALNDYDYYHHVSGNYMMHKDVINSIAELYATYLDFYMRKNDWKYTDQVIWTKIYRDYPEKFHMLGKTYGEIWSELI